MDSDKYLFKEFLRIQVCSFRADHSWTQEHMANSLRISTRSYVDQEHGRYGFSSLSFVFFLLLLPDDEVLVFLRKFEVLIDYRNS